MNETLKELRIKNGLTSREMAHNLNISKAYYSQLENKNRKLSYQMAFDIAKIFDLKPDEIFYEEFNKKN